MKKLKATIIMPIYNGASTLLHVFKALDEQYDQELIDRIIIINDNSRDNSLEIIKSYAGKSPYSVIVIDNTQNIGLAASYNNGINRCTTKYIITMHQDIVLEDLNSFTKILLPLGTSDAAVSYPVLTTPVRTWSQYNFWQKAMFDRFKNREIPLMSGKFDCFDRNALKKVGYFDETLFRSAGEDGDLKRKLISNGYRLINSHLRVVHIHNMEPSFNRSKYIHKENQIAEAQGVLLRVHGFEAPKNAALAYFRPALIIMLLIPALNIISFIMIIMYAYAYTKNLFQQNITLSEKLTLYFTNIQILFSATYFFFKGFLKRKQLL